MKLRNASAPEAASPLQGNANEPFGDVGSELGALHIILHRQDSLHYWKLITAMGDFFATEKFLEVVMGIGGLTDADVPSALRAAIQDDVGRYELLAWCVLPTHVHILIRHTGQAGLDTIVDRWKTAAERAGLATDGRGSRPWAFGFLSRRLTSQAEVSRISRHIEARPVACLKAETPDAWPWSSASRAAPRGPPSRDQPRHRAGPDSPAAGNERRHPVALAREDAIWSPGARHVTFCMGDVFPYGTVRRLMAAKGSACFGIIDSILDEDAGGALLLRAVVADALENALLESAGRDYQLLAWFIAPSHVHVLIREAASLDLAAMVERWKAAAFGAVEQRRLVLLSPWGPGYYDTHLSGVAEIAAAKRAIDHHRSKPIVPA